MRPCQPSKSLGGGSRRRRIQAEGICVQAWSGKTPVQGTEGSVTWSTDKDSKGGGSYRGKLAQVMEDPRVTVRIWAFILTGMGSHQLG